MMNLNLVPMTKKDTSWTETKTNKRGISGTRDTSMAKNGQISTTSLLTLQQIQN